jgi:non-ribosomal peptide synthetase component F
MHKRNNDPPVKRRTDSPAETQPLIPRIATNEYSNIQRQRRVSQRLKSSKKLLALLPEDEQDKFWLYGEGPPATLPFDLIHDAFSEQVSKNPLNVAVEHGQGSITYAELDDWSNQLAAFLVSQGIGVGDSVPLFLERSISMVVGILAILKTGAS